MEVRTSPYQKHLQHLRHQALREDPSSAGNHRMSRPWGRGDLEESTGSLSDMTRSLLTVSRNAITHQARTLTGGGGRETSMSVTGVSVSGDLNRKGRGNYVKYRRPTITRG